MSIWTVTPNLEHLRKGNPNTLGHRIGIEVIEVGDDFLRARLPVDARTFQPFGRLHGGASAALVEEVGSIAANHCVAPDHLAVGLELNCNHLRGVSSGYVTATARAVHLGRATQVWDIRLEDDQQRLTCVARLTTSIIAIEHAMGRSRAKASP